MLSKIYGILYKRLLGTGVSKYKSVNKVHDYVDSKIQKKIVTIEGIKFLGVVENIIEVHVTNIPEIEFCKKEIKKGDTVVDIGANIGLTLVQKGVSNKNESGKLYKSNVSGGHSLIKNEWAKEYTNIQTVTLDDYFRREEIDMIKIDAEGFELEVIEGGKKLLENNKNMKIISEFGGYYYKRNNSKVLYPKILHEMGYNLFGVIDKSTGKSKIVNKNFDELMEFYSKTNSFILNLIWK